MEQNQMKWKIADKIKDKPDSKYGVKPLKESKKHLANLKHILQNSNATLFRGKDGDDYKCNFCMKKYKQPKDLKSHFLDEHNDFQIIKLPKIFQYVHKIDITELKCKICGRPFDRLENFTEHLRREHEINIHTDIRNQLIPFKFDTSQLRCAICSTEFTNYKMLLEHMHGHFRNFVCDLCSAGFVTKQLLARHRRRHAVDTFKCDHCEKTFNCDQKRRDHQQRIHLGIKKKNKCHFCLEKFADYWTKVNHMIKDHGVPPVVLKCQACERSFSNKRALTRHVKEDHLMERKHACTICDMRFFLKGRMRDHMAVHTGDKRFQCHVCTKWYMTKKSLAQHLRSHADDRRFICTECSQAFVHQSSLNSHMKTKHGD